MLINLTLWASTDSLWAKEPGRWEVRRSDATIRILALRAEFQPDALATTTGDGRFDLSTNSSYHLDHPPHDRRYFEHQLLALSHYFHTVSRGKVKISADVFPIQNHLAYTLPHDMVYYSGQEEEALKQKGWAELLHDALQAAAAQGGIDFSAYQCVIVFHAGVGQDFAFDFDTTPYDIQSAYIDFTTLQQGLAPGDAHFKGIELPGGVLVTEGIILPETQNQEGYDLGLLGTMTLMVGSYLGMPSLFDTKTGRTGIGRWGLMDQGSYNFQGFIPAEPCAWEKVYMGWETPVTVRNGENIRIGSSTTKSAPHIVKIPISEDEYFLIENRQRDVNRDGIAVGRDENGRKAEFDSTGRVVAPADIGVLTRIDEYDFGLPNSGILIWHIDERVIAAGLASNSININRTHRGVDLVECDGAQDIGYVYTIFDAAYGTEVGDYWDTYWSGNISHKYVNNGNDVAFSPTSIPNSNAHSGARSHIRIENFSERDTIMTVDIRSQFAQPGFPHTANREFAAGALLATSAVDGRSGWLLAAAKDGSIWAWQANGSPLFPGGDHLVATAQDSVLLPPALDDLDGDGIEELIVVDVKGEMSLWHLRDHNGDHQLDLAFRQQFASAICAGPMILSSATSGVIIAGHGNGGCYLQDLQQPGYFQSLQLSTAAICGLAAFPGAGADFIATCENGKIFACRLHPPGIVWENSLPFTGFSQPLVADFDGTAGLEVAVVGREGSLACFAGDGNDLGIYRPPFAPSFVSAPALGDIDGDGLPEILLSSDKGLLALEFTGATTLNFPATKVVGTSTLAGAPIWRQTIEQNDALCLASSEDRLYAVNGLGRMDADFPLSAGRPITVTPAMADLDGDNRVELAIINSAGQVYVWKTPWPWNRQLTWSQHGGGTRRDFCRVGVAQAAPISADWLPAKKVFCYPNPVEDGRANIRFTLGKTTDQVTVQFYTLAGRSAGSLQATDLPPGDHELAWDVGRVHSGVYMARLEAVSGSERQVRFIKIAVVK